MSQIVEITFAPDGSVETKVKGGCGKGCKDATKAIREALGQTVEDKELPEYRQVAVAKIPLAQGGKR